MTLRSFFKLLIAAVAVLLLIGVGGFLWLLGHSPLGLLAGNSTPYPTAAVFISRQAPIMGSLLLNPGQLESLRLAAARPSDRRQARTELNQFKQNLLGNADLNYERDVQPWLGDELTWAVTAPDFDRDAQNGLQPGYLLAIATKDPARSREFLQLFWQKRALTGQDLVFEQYKGVKLIYGSPPPPLPDQPTDTLPQKASLATAVVGDRFVLFANSVKVLRDAINNVQAPDLNLQESLQYQQAIQSFHQGQIGLAFVNLPQLAAWIRHQSTASTAELETLHTYDSLAIALKANPQGLLAETALVPPAGQALASATPALTSTKATQYIPIASPLTLTSTDLQQGWTQVIQGLTGYEALAQLIEQPIADLQKRWGIALPEAVFSWVNGEYALGFVPAPVKDKAAENQAAPVDWIFVTERSPQAIAGIERMDGIAKQQGLDVGNLTVEGKLISAWTKLLTTTVSDVSTLALQAEVQGVHATAGNYEIFATSIAALNQALQAPQKSLGNSEALKAAIAPLSQPNDGYLYLNWEALRPFLEQQLPIVRLLELAGQPFFRHLESLTLTSYGREDNVSRGGVFIKLS